MLAQTSEHPASQLLRALGDPVRFRLLRELPNEDAAEIPVGGLAKRLGVADTVVSQHLRVLSGLGLVGSRRSGRTVRYYVKAAALRAAREVLAKSLPALFGGASEQSRLSARNQLYGKVIELVRGDVTCEVTIDIGAQLVTAVITNGSVDRLDLQVGDTAAPARNALVVHGSPAT